MPAESAIAEPPPKTAEPPQSLKALFQIPGDLVEPEPEVVPEVEPEKPPVTPHVEPEAAPAAPVEDAKKSDLTSRLAPDFAALKTKSDVPIEPPVKITDEMIAAAKTPKAQADMRKFRESYDKLEKEVSELRAKPAALPEDTETKTLYEVVRKERDELLEKVERANLFDSPKFQQEHLVPRQKSFDRLYNIVKESGSDLGALQRAISMTPGKVRVDALDEIRAEIGSEMLKGQFDRLVEDIDSRTAEINEKVRNAKQTSQELRHAEALTREQQNSKITQEFETLLAAARRDSAQNIMPELFTKVDDPDLAWWNETIDRDDKIAREALLEATPQKAAYAAVFASKLGTVLEMWRNERKAREAVEQENRELKGAEPTLTADRRAPKVEGDGVNTDDILTRLHSGAYKK